MNDTGKTEIKVTDRKGNELITCVLEPYAPTYNEQYLARLIKRATPRWSDVYDADQWLSNIRGIDD